ncbi:hypothetical protein D3C77_571180 [compost metagenome]
MLIGKAPCLPNVRIIVRHACHRYDISGFYFHCHGITRLGMRMQPSGYPVVVQPFELVGDRLLGGQLHPFVNRRMQIVALLRCRQFRNTARHISRVDRHAFIPVFAAQFMLVLHLQSIEADKFLLGIFQPRILIVQCHPFSDGIIPRLFQR